MKWLLLLILCIRAAQAGVVEPSVLGPTSATQNAFSLWSDSTGRTLSNSVFLLDSSLWGSGSASLQLPNNGSTNRTWSLPNNNGEILVNGSNQSLFNMFVNSTTVSWFNNVDPSKQMNFDLSAIGTGQTITIKPGATGLGATGTYTLQPIATGTNIATILISDSPSMTTPTLTNASFVNFYSLGWRSDAAIATPSTGMNVWGSLNSDTIKVKRTDGSVINVTGYKRTEIDFGSTPLVEKLFTITDSTIAASDSLVTSKNNTIEAKISRDTSTGKTSVDETDMDTIYVNCTPGAGNLTCLVRSLNGFVAGTFKLDYRLAGTQ